MHLHPDSLVEAEKSAALDSLRLTTDKCAAYKKRVEALVNDIEQARLAAAAFALAAQARENELRYGMHREVGRMRSIMQQHS